MIFVEGFFYMNFAGLCSMIFFVLSFARKWNERNFRIICVRQEKFSVRYDFGSGRGTKYGRR